MSKVRSVESHFFKKIYESLDKIEKVLDSMEGKVKELEEMEERSEESIVKLKPVLRLVRND